MAGVAYAVEAVQVPIRLSREAAISKYSHFKDRDIGGVGASIAVRAAGLVAAGANEEILKQFWNETKHLSWPNTCGESPWETASLIGAMLVARENDPQSFHSCSEYIEALRAAIDQAQVLDPQEVEATRPRRPRF